MTLIDGKQVIFSTNFLAAHDTVVLIDNIPEIESKGLRFSFLDNPDGDAGEISSGRGEGNLKEIFIIPHRISSGYASPKSIWVEQDGTVIYVQYSQQTIGEHQSLIHFTLLKKPD